jgi:cryptochrome
MAVEMASGSAIHWFRKGLRLHDNPALLDACRKSRRVYPVFIIDPWFAKPDIVGINRYSFLLQSLSDLDSSLRSIGSRLYVVRGKPEEQLPILIDRWNVQLLTFERDTEPYAKKRDKAIVEMLADRGITVSSHCSHTLRDPDAYIAASKGKPPVGSYGSFCKLFLSMGHPREAVETVSAAIMPRSEGQHDDDGNNYNVPTLDEMGYSGRVSDKFPGMYAIPPPPNIVCWIERSLVLSRQLYFHARLHSASPLINSMQ